MAQQQSEFRRVLEERAKRRQMEVDASLEKEFERIGEEHRKALLKISARVVLGSSVIRVFKKRTKGKLKAILESINVAELLKHKNQGEYRLWFEKHLSVLAAEIKATNPKSENPEIYPGYKWGHATKVLNLFVREIVEYKRYFSDEQASKIRYLLYVPIDSVVIKKLKSLGVSLAYERINGIDSEEKFYGTQDLLERTSKAVNVPRIWFDDVWGDREDDDDND